MRSYTPLPIASTCLVWALLLLLALPAKAQERDTLHVALPDLVIRASRALHTGTYAPFAVALYERSSEQMAAEPGLSLEGTLRGLPGLWLNDREHYALGERLIIRGMGYRAAFGVRGTQVILDGIPLTLPDGQTTLDVADPAFVRRAELIRGPSSLYWGNASGGVLFLSTAARSDTSFLRLRAMGGSHGLRHLAGNVRHRGLYAYASRVTREGYRAHSAGNFLRGGLHGRIDMGSRTGLHLVFTGALQDADAPGGLTLEQVVANPRQADPRYIIARAGKESQQLQAGATLIRETSLGLFTATVYGLQRSLNNPLTFAYIDLERIAGGARLQLQHTAGRFGWGVGLDVGLQRDERQNTDNDNGKPGKERLLDQVERVRNAAIYGTLHMTLTPKLTATAGLRLDGIRFSMEDRWLGNADQSGERNFRALSPAAGLSYQAGKTLLFANINTAFETPTTTELVNRPDGMGGFHPTLAPQRTLGLEAGARRAPPDSPLWLDIALYRLHIDGRLVPRQDIEGRTYFENAGKNTHQGVEVGFTWHAHTSSSLRMSYAGNHFVFRDGTASQSEERHIPGVPNHHLYLGLRTHHHGLLGQLATTVTSHAYADSDNTTRNDGYVVVDVSLSYTSLRYLQPFLHIRNAFDTQYSGSLVVNAFGGRYYEPAAGRTVQAGISVTL